MQTMTEAQEKSVEKESPQLIQGKIPAFEAPTICLHPQTPPNTMRNHFPQWRCEHYP